MSRSLSSQSTAGLATEYLFRWTGIAPAASTAQWGTPAQDVWGLELHHHPRHHRAGRLRQPVLAVAQPGTARRRRLRQKPGVRHAGSKSPTPRPLPASTVRPTTSGSDHCQQRSSAAAGGRPGVGDWGHGACRRPMARPAPPRRPCQRGSGAVRVVCRPRLPGRVWPAGVGMIQLLVRL